MSKALLENLRSQSFWLAPLVFGILMLLFWEGLLGLLNPDGFVLPRPSEIFRAFFDDFSNIWSATKNTGFIMITGLVGGVVLGALVAVLVTQFRAANETLTPLAIALNAIPIIALAPIFNNWLGLTSPRSNQAVVLLLVFFPVFINTARGLTQVAAEQLELMHSYAAGKWRIMWNIRIPNALPFFFTAFKLVASLCVIAAIVAEYFGGNQDSLGSVITTNASFTKYPEAWATVVAGSIIGIGLYAIVAILEQIALNRQGFVRIFKHRFTKTHTNN